MLAALAAAISVFCLHDQPDNAKHELVSIGTDATFKPVTDSPLLHLCRTAVRALPVSVSSLCSLQILIADDCSELKSLPPGLGAIAGLRQLKLSRYITCHGIISR